MKIRIPKLRILLNYFEKPEGWIGFILVFNCIYPALVNFLNIPMAINYLNDLLCGLLLLAVFNSLKKGGIKSAKIPAGIFLALFIETALSYIFNLYSPLIYIWGLRTLFRYFVFFFSCTMFVKKTDIESVFNFLYKILFVNLVFATMEYAMKYKLDSVTGLYSFGPNIPGGSAPINVLMCVVCAYYIIKYFENSVHY